MPNGIRNQPTGGGAFYKAGNLATYKAVHLAAYKALNLTPKIERAIDAYKATKATNRTKTRHWLPIRPHTLSGLIESPL